MNRPALTNRAAEDLTGGRLTRARLLAAAFAVSSTLLCAPAHGSAIFAQSPHDANAGARQTTRTRRVLRVAASPTPRPTQEAPATERPSAFFERLGAPFAGRKLARATAPMVGLVASTSVVQPCPGAEGSARVALTASGFDPERRRLRYRWRATGGRVEGAGESVIWDLSGVAPGGYSVNVSLEVAGDASYKLADKEAHVVVRACRPPPPRRAVCPTISLCCRASVTSGDPALFEATLEGGVPISSSPTYDWTISAGRIVSGSGTRSIGVDTAGLGGQTVVAVFEPRGYGAGCRSSCLTSVLRAPPATPTPTPPPTPTPRPPGVVVATTPTPAPTPSPTPSPAATPWRPPALVSPNISTASQSELKNRDALRRLLLLLLLGALAAASYFGLKRKRKLLAAAEAGGAAVVAGAAAAAAAVAAATEEKGDEVHCTVFAPNQCAPGSMFLVQAFAHLAEHAPLLLEMANDADEDTTQRGTEELGSRIERGKELVFGLRMPGLEVDEPVQSLVWDGDPESVQFGVTVPETCRAGSSLIGTVTVSYLSVPIGHVKFKFKICDPQAAAQPAQVAQPPQMQAPTQAYVRYRQAFISYASEDRAEVLKRVQMLKTMNIRFFQDLLSLEPGDRWERELYKEIDQSDVLFLFWSEAAKKSRWVRREVQYALQRKAGNDAALPEITPVILEGPPIVPPPDYLGDVHFNDVLLYLINEEEQRAAQRKRTRRPRAKKRAPKKD